MIFKRLLPRPQRNFIQRHDPAAFAAFKLRDLAVWHLEAAILEPFTAVFVNLLFRFRQIFGSERGFNANTAARILPPGELPQQVSQYQLSPESCKRVENHQTGSYQDDF